ncbi:MAG: lipoyl(octanoyl) transferase LipB, partial [Mangrovibacterium sp.]|nr:lipoyl(octanoyl) transferase LipB [Mangrovibacterium sp.]
MTTFHYEDTGLIDYQKCWGYQEKLLEQVQADKKSRKGPTPLNYFLLVEHPHVYTLGKSGDAHNLLVQDEFLKKIGATFCRIDRGGDITYHGPGQLVGYPIIDLEYYRIGIRQYIEKMEEAIIAAVACYGISSGRKEGATGVWIDATIPEKARKICAIGVRVSRYVTMHGFALNVNTDMRYFHYINPCGFTAYGTTSMERELGRPIDMQEVKNAIREKFND